MNEQSWRKVFVGREDEMELLQKAWGKAKGGEPQFVTFLAETGVGKTRLVQHFYSELTNREDPSNYWPDTMESAVSSLAINPSFPEAWKQSDIPWLWWGLRATDPTSRNRQESLGCAIQNSAPKLEPHVHSILSKRKKRNLGIELGIGLGKIAADIAADWVSLGILSKGHDLYELGKKFKEERARQEQEQLTVYQVTEQKKSDLSDLAFDYLKTVLNKKDKDATTVPFILILDDAQWFDRTTLRFVELLWQAACKDGWPLLIIATHWHVEWEQNKQISEITPIDQLPINLVDITRRNAKFFDGWSPYQLQTMPCNTLQPILIKALPGLTAKQQQIILERVGGNPNFLSDLIQWVQEDAGDFFEHGDCSGPLTADGEEDVTGQLNRDHMDLVHKRFNQLDEKMRTLLGFGSYQGMRFIEPLMLDVAQKLKGEGNWQKYYREAVHPHVVINRINDVADEFCQRNMFEAANQHLHAKKTNANRFRTILLDVLIQWHESGKITEHLVSEREALLTFLWREIDGLEKHTERQVRVQLDLVHLLYFYCNRQSDAADIAAKMVRKKSSEKKRILSKCSSFEKGNLAILLANFNYFDEALYISSDCIDAIGVQDRASKFALAFLYMTIGNIHVDMNQKSKALSYFKRALDLLEGNETKEKIDDEQRFLAMLHLNIARTMSSIDKKIKNAHEAIKIWLELFDKLKSDFPLGWITQMAGAYSNLGNIYSSINDNKAFSAYDKAIFYRTKLVELARVRGCGLQEWSSDLARSYLNRGASLCRIGETQQASVDFNTAIKIKCQILKDFSFQPSFKWMEELASAYFNRGLLNREQNEFDLAIDDYTAAIKIHNGLPDRCAALSSFKINTCKQELAEVLSELADELIESNPKRTLDYYRKSLFIMDSLSLEMNDDFPDEWRIYFIKVIYNYGCVIDYNGESRELIKQIFEKACLIGYPLYKALGVNMPDPWRNILNKVGQKVLLFRDV